MASADQGGLTFLAMNGISISAVDKKYPEFVKLLHFLNTCISPSGTTKELEKEVQQARNKLTAEKFAYLQNLTLYQTVKEIVLDMDLKGAEKDVDSIKFEKKLKEILVMSEVEQKLRCLQLDELGDAKTEEGLLGIKSLGPKPTFTDEEAKRLTSLVTERLEAKYADVAGFCESVANIAKGSKTMPQSTRPLNDNFTWLPDFIESMKREIDDKRKKLNYSRIKQQEIIVQYYKAIHKVAQHMIELGELLIRNGKADDDSTKDLFLQSEILLLKLKVFSLDITTKMYNKNVVEAHLKIKNHLDEETAKVESEKEATDLQVAAYESADSEFKELLQNYVVLMAQIEKSTWTMEKLPKE